MDIQKKDFLQRNKWAASVSRYNNLGWFGQHPRIYELGSMLISPIRRSATRAIPHSSRLRILDLACGTGANTYVLARVGHEVIGIDLDEEMLNWARKKNHDNLTVSFIQGDATNLEFDNGTFDCVTISFAMHDVPYEIGIKMLAEAKRVLIPSGEVIIIDYNEPDKHPIAKLLCFFARLYESPNFEKFIKIGLRRYLSDAGLTLSDRFTIHGAVQVVSCS
jgi:demethylmenaquinone methyltransferase/2-methoxy-6-polyprenyl-1,4-benzoquinol methylase